VCMQSLIRVSRLRYNMEKKIETYDETACRCTWYADCVYCMVDYENSKGGE
jgi:hypothetical protein